MANRQQRRMFHRKEELDLGVGLKALKKALANRPERKAVYKDKMYHQIRSTAMETYAKMTDEEKKITPEQMLAGLDSNIREMCRTVGLTDDELIGIFKDAVSNAK